MKTDVSRKGENKQRVQKAIIKSVKKKKKYLILYIFYAFHFEMSFITLIIAPIHYSSSSYVIQNTI